ncbi:hypothetical protein NDU88_003320 [Pleurodeles waltl]|uniref:Uncharacterized protein n=1 Tax=Pleurodeles waltl TaxID=8319 RepID=A0AAV7RH24_PLEWA|nr:hypothetical protein NDU88_003320 [Pleurodeles waltl]
MLSKGAKVVLSAGRGKPIRTSMTTRLGAPVEVKHGLGEKTNANVKNTSLDRFFFLNREAAPGETGMAASVDASEQPGLTKTDLESPLQEELEGSGDGISDDIIQLKNPCDMLPQICHMTENQADLMNSRRADKALIQPENVQQRSPDGNGGSLVEDLVNSGNMGLSNGGKMEAARSATPRDKEVVQSDTFFSLSDHSSWSSNERSDFEADKISLDSDSEISSLALDKELLESGKITTVRKKQRKRSEHLGSTKHLSIPQDTKGLQWDYSNTQFKGDLTVYGNTEKQCNPVSLETIYQSIMEHREESKIESCELN